MELLRSDANAWGEALAVLLVVLPAALAALGMRRAYRRRRAAEEVAAIPLPTVAAPQRAADGEALYTGTTRAGSRSQRVTAHGLFGRGPARYWFEPEGLVFARFRGPVVLIADITEVGLVGAHAGRVVAPERIAVVRWALGDTGFAFPDAEQARAFVQRLETVHA